MILFDQGVQKEIREIKNVTGQNRNHATKGASLATLAQNFMGNQNKQSQNA